jgi:hypothetical protein
MLAIIGLVLAILTWMPGPHGFTSIAFPPAALLAMVACDVGSAGARRPGRVRHARRASRTMAAATIGLLVVRCVAPWPV